MIKYGLKAATKDIDVLLYNLKEIDELIQALLRSGYHIILTDTIWKKQAGQRGKGINIH